LHDRLKIGARKEGGQASPEPSHQDLYWRRSNVVATWSLGNLVTISFVLCVIYGLIVPTRLGMAPFLEMLLPAFKWLTFWGVRLWPIESFLHGAFLGLMFAPIYNLLNRRTLPVSRESANWRETDP